MRCTRKNWLKIVFLNGKRSSKGELEPRGAARLENSSSPAAAARRDPPHRQGRCHLPAVSGVTENDVKISRKRRRSGGEHLRLDGVSKSFRRFIVDTVKYNTWSGRPSLDVATLTIEHYCDHASPSKYTPAQLIEMP